MTPVAPTSAASTATSDIGSLGAPTDAHRLTVTA
jgi:hypothetical protein